MRHLVGTLGPRRGNLRQMDVEISNPAEQALGLWNLMGEARRAVGSAPRGREAGWSCPPGTATPRRGLGTPSAKVSVGNGPISVRSP